jgi:hypothetical protein
MISKMFFCFGFPALFLGCATAPFQPAEHVKQSLENGPASAHYMVRTGPGDFGAVNVDFRTEGIRGSSTKVSSEPATVQISMDVTNNSSKPILLDSSSLGLRLVLDGKKEAPMIRPAVPSIDNTVAGHSNKQYFWDFPLPPGIKSKQISAFELSWGLALDTENYAQTTGFSREHYADDRDVYHVYDPLFYPYGSVGYYGSPHHSGSSVNLGVGFGVVR